MRKNIYISGYKNKLYCFPMNYFQGYQVSHKYTAGFLDISLQLFFKAKKVNEHFVFEIEPNLAEFLDDTLSDFYYDEFSTQIDDYIKDGNVEVDLLEASLRGYIERTKILLADDENVEKIEVKEQ